MAENDVQAVLSAIQQGNMQTQSKILVRDICDFEKMPKTGFSNVTDVYSKSSKNQTKGDRDLKYGLK